MIKKYMKIITEYTTYTLLEPDYQDDDTRCTELCTIGDDTYIHVPLDVTLPSQPEQITLIDVDLTDELRSELKALSPHTRLINARVVEKIREKYTHDDEFKMHRKHMQGGATPETQAYINHVAAAMAWGVAEKGKIGL